MLAVCNTVMVADRNGRNAEPVIADFLDRPDPTGSGGVKPRGATSIRAMGEVEAVLHQHCFKCHGPTKQKSGLRLDTLSVDFVGDRAAAERWHDVKDIVQLGEMPPEDEPDLNSEERRVLTDWIQHNLRVARDRSTDRLEGVSLRRLTNVEYRFTLGDLLGVPGNYGDRLPSDPALDSGFTNNRETLQMSSLQLEQYLETARAAMQRVIVEGDLPAPYNQRSSVPWEGFKIDHKFGRPSRQLGRGSSFTMEVEDPPVDHEFMIRVTARADLREDKAAPVMQVLYGHTALGAIPIFSEVGMVEVASTEFEVYEFRGNGADFPNAKDLGAKWSQIAVVRNKLEDGEDPPPSVPVKPGSSVMVIPHDPHFPQIVVESVEFVGNAEESWPPATHRNILFAADDEGSGDYWREVINRFLRRAWRRPVAEWETDRYYEHFIRLVEKTASPTEAISETLAVSLASTNFLYLGDQTAKRSVERITNHALATRLSYFLWSSMPDERLFGLAEKGILAREGTLQAEVERLLADEKSERFVDQFTEQWLDLGGLERVAINPQFFPEFDEGLKSHMIGETRAYFREILRTGDSVLELLRSDWTMLNASLARYYKLSGPKSQRFERVSLDGANRPGGLLGHASMHLMNSNGEHSDPIKRAVWIRSRLLNDPPASPPPDVPALPVDEPGFAELTSREQLERHRRVGTCADCHRNIDPWGIALEHYDAVGNRREVIRRLRENESGAGEMQDIPVDASARFPNGVEVNGLDDLQSYLLEERADQFVRALTSKMLSYALGRSIGWTDEETVRQLSAEFAASGHRISALITAIATSDAFQKP